MSDDGVLDLDATHPPSAWGHQRRVVMSTKLPTHLALFVEHRALQEGVTPSRWIRRLIEHEQRDDLPRDVTEWLLVQAAQCGAPGDPQAGLIAVVRHLAQRWPDGGRLR